MHLAAIGFVHWQTAVYMTDKNDILLSNELRVFAANTPEQRLQEIDDRLHKDPEHIKIAGVFGADGHRVAGNIESLPTGLPLDVPTGAVIVRRDEHGRELQKVRLDRVSLRYHGSSGSHGAHIKSNFVFSTAI